MAALVSVPECEKKPDLARELNVEGALRIFTAAARCDIKHFIHVSTAHIYAPSMEPLRPNSSMAPRSVYARTKLEAEVELRKISLQFPQIRLTIARVFGVLSKAMRPGYLLTNLHERARRKDFSPIPGIDNIRDYMDAGDICKELLRLAQAAEPPPLVHVCSGKGTSVRAVAEKVFREYGLDPLGLSGSPGRADDIPSIVGEATKF